MLGKTVPALLCSLLICGTSSAGLNTHNTTGTAMEQIKTEISVSNVAESDRAPLKSHITNMNATGYIGTNLKNNIKLWQINAYRNNKNIVDQIAFAKDNVCGFETVLGYDHFGVDKYFDIDIVERTNGKAIAWTLKSIPSSFGDRDIRFANDSEAITDWYGAKQLWVKLDASEITSPVGIRMAFEENHTGRESYRVKSGAAITLIGETTSAVTADDDGYASVPKGFVGYMAFPLDNDTFELYYNEGGNGRLDINKVVQFQLSVKGDSGMLNKTLYMDEFGIVGIVDGETPPAQAEAGQTYKTVWDMHAITQNTGHPSVAIQWYGEFAGKLLTGMAYSYKISPSDELKAAADELVDDLKKAQGDDGYLGVFTGGARYSIHSPNWDLWNQYHCITGLLEWHNATGNTDALDVARKAADLIYETFRDRSYLVAGGFETNRGIAHGFAQLYQATGEQKYINEAERIIQKDCMDAVGWYKTALKGGHFYLSSSNRWEVLHMIMTLGILYEATGKREYYDVMSAVWEDILETDVHNGGGFTTDECAQGDPYRNGIIETCCTVAWLAFTNEYYKYNKSVAVADEFERTYYNAMLGSLLDTDKYCAYNTPMNGIQGSCGHYDGRRVASQQDISFQYNSGSPDMNCCQANLARGIGQLSEWAAVSEGNKLYLNYFGNSNIETSVGGKKVALRQTTAYPQNGAISIEVNDLTEPAEFSLLVRVPTWAYGSVATVDGMRTVLKAGEYYEIQKTWHNGDKVSLDIAIPFMFWAGAGAQTGLTSAFYGPVLLTLDQAHTSAEAETAFDAEDFEKAAISSGTAGGCMLFFDVPTPNGTVRLTDFASAGKYNGESSPSSYMSWLNVSGVPNGEQNAHKRWQSSSKLKIVFDENIAPEHTMYYPGETVRFKVALPQNASYEIVSENGLDISCDDGVYSFVMPNESVKIGVEFKQIPPPASAPENNTGLAGWKIALITVSSVVGAAAIGVGAAIAVKKRKKSRK